MDSERWKQVEQVYQRVLDSAPERQAAVLQESCSDDPDLLRELESLLVAREQAGGFLSPEWLNGYVEEMGSEPAASAVGSKLGPYEILSCIGAGAMAEVYLARDNRLDRSVALKILPARFTRHAERVARFRREAKIASALNHPNIMTIYDIGEINETCFIAAEFIEGLTIRQRVASGKIELKEALGIAVQCTRALEAAHQAGIIHRDIKPENIMVRPDGAVKVVDFGLARIARSGMECAANATQFGALMGTPRYMSPEQACGKDLDARTDIFSLGTVLYEMVMGEPAIPGATAAEIFGALLGSRYRNLPQHIDCIPDELDTILSKALHAERELRYQTMRAFETDLQNLKDRVEAGLTPMRSKRAIERSTTSQRPLRIRRELLIAAILLAAGLMLAWYMLVVGRGSRLDSAPMNVVPLTSFAGYKDFGSFSPDGSRIAFSWSGGRRAGTTERSIYVKKTMGSDEPVQLTFGHGDDQFPVWSPDGRYIAFCRAVPQPAPNQYAVYVVPTVGGPERKIAEGGMGVSWSADGKALAIAGTPADLGGIFLLSLDTGERRSLTNPHPYFDSLPAFSPDGQWIAFTRNPASRVQADFGFYAREIFVVPKRGGFARRLTFDNQPTYGATWTADSREIVFSSNRGRGGESLWRINLDGGTPRRVLASGQGNDFYPSISRQGNRVVYTESFTDTNIYEYDGPGFGDAGAPRRFTGPKGLILSSRRDDSASISPGGETIAFVSKRTGNEEIWVCDRNGGRPLQLTSFNGPGAGTPRWSPDGQWIAFDSIAAGNSDIYIIKPNGGTPNRLTTGPHSNFMPSWSADRKWIYFKSDRTGSDQIWKIPSGGGSAIQVTHRGGSEAFASPDGKLVYYTKGPLAAIWMVPTDGGREEPVPELKSFDKIFRSWGIIKQGIYFISREDAPHQIIHFFSFANCRVTSLVTLDSNPIWNYPDVALSADGRQLLYASMDHEINDLMLIENFR